MKQSADQINICANCKYGKLIPMMEDVLCSHRGIVASDYLCKKYEYNYLLKEGKRKRAVDTERFTADDFSLEF